MVRLHLVSHWILSKWLHAALASMVLLCNSAVSHTFVLVKQNSPKVVMSTAETTRVEFTPPGLHRLNCLLEVPPRWKSVFSGWNLTSSGSVWRQSGKNLPVSQPISGVCKPHAIEGEDCCPLPRHCSTRWRENCLVPGSVKWLENKGPTPCKGQGADVMLHTVLYHIYLDGGGQQSATAMIWDLPVCLF